GARGKRDAGSRPVTWPDPAVVGRRVGASIRGRGGFRGPVAAAVAVRARVVGVVPARAGGGRPAMNRQIGDRRVLTAERAFRIAPHLDLAEAHAEGVVSEETPDQGLDDAEQSLD